MSILCGLIYLGYGVLGGIALGIGYISPVSTLIKWFPDRPGMATGMAIMGFGGGAFIASPLSVWLMRQFTTATHIGVMETFIVLGVVYFVFMVIGSIIVRVPPDDWKPEGYVGAIHGLMLTAWSAAGIFGPVLVNYIREHNVTYNVPKADTYNITM